tara:strand:- start:418 stop:615 length:198 start_codon:yes stop_codon:yes gene_type:complete
MMRKRLQIGKLLKGDKRLEGESFTEYKDRLKLEKSLLNDYGHGVIVTTEDYRQNKINPFRRNKKA